MMFPVLEVDVTVRLLKLTNYILLIASDALVRSTSFVEVPSLFDGP